MKIFCRNIDRYIEIQGAETLAAIASRIEAELGFRPICARVNNKTESLSYPVYQPKIVEFQARDKGSGPRVYTRSLCMMLCKALQDLLPGARLRIEHSMSHGYYCRIEGRDSVDNDLCLRLKAAMNQMVRNADPFVIHEVPAQHAREVFEKAGMKDKVELLATSRPVYVKYYTLGDFADSFYGVLAPDTSHIDVFDLIPYHEGFLLMPFDSADPSRPATPIDQEKMFRAFTEHLNSNRIVGVGDVAQLNRCVEDHRAADIINVAETLHEKSLAKIAEDIAARYADGGARIVLIAGPSSSGKTTSTKRLAIELMTNLLKPQLISLDDYFVNRENTPRDDSGDYDYESLYALDLPKFNDDLNRILAGEEVELPTYNFETGMRTYRGDKVRLSEGSILLIEGIHGLNPELTAHIPEKAKYRIYISALTTLSIDDHNWVPTTDNRLLRRIIRDHKYRGTSAEETIRRWPSVRRGEEKWIFPYQENADAMFNSSLLYELGVMKDYGDTILRTVPRDVPEYAEAYRLRTFLSYFMPIGLHMIPSTSVLREFLGGSSFRY